MRKNLPFLIRFSFWLIIDLLIAYTVFGQQPVIATHPRIFLDAATKAALIAKKNANDPDWQALLAQANKYTTGTVIPWDETSASDAQYYSFPEDIFYSYCGSSWEEAAMTLALAHQVTKTNNAGANPTIYSNKLLQFADVIINAYHDYPPNDGGLNISSLTMPMLPGMWVKRLPIDDMDAATGFIVHSDELAIERQLQADVFFAKAIELNDTDYGDICYLSVALNAGIKNYVANYSGLDSVDPVFGNNIHQTKPNVGFGIMWYTDWYYLGLSAPQLDFTSLGTASVQNNSSFVNHYYLSGAFITDLADDIKIRPALQVAYAKGSPLVGNLSAMIFMQETVGLGLSCRFKNDMAAIITVNFDRIHLGYNYQFATSANNIGGFNSATHEVSLSYRFGDISKRKLL